MPTNERQGDEHQHYCGPDGWAAGGTVRGASPAKGTHPQLLTILGATYLRYGLAEGFVDWTVRWTAP